MRAPRASRRRLALPENYHKQIVGTGIVGAMVVEASPWVEDNLWILERANSDPVFVGVVGDLDPSKPDFGEYLNRFSKDPLWRGIRYARVWQMESGKQVLKPGMADGLKLLAQMGQTLDMANPSFDLLRGALLAMEAVPDLRGGDGSHAIAGSHAGDPSALRFPDRAIWRSIPISSSSCRRSFTRMTKASR